MKVCVIGGGLFGCTAAIHAARAGHEVHLYEKSRNIMQAASGINQYRLHLGYHYPRSPETGRECRAALQSFVDEYPACVIRTGEHYYAIAKGSVVSANDYVSFLDREGLDYSVIDKCAHVDQALVDLVVRVPEARVDVDALRGLVKRRLSEAGVFFHRDRIMPDHTRGLTIKDFDRVIVAAYANSNRVMGELGLPPVEYRFQVVEKPVCFLPDEFRGVSIVLLDGPFGCVDPDGIGFAHVLGHVTESVHAANDGHVAIIPEHLTRVLNAGVVNQQQRTEPMHTHWPQIVGAMTPYIPMLPRARHLGSMYTVRAVLAGVETTDKRPTLVERLNEQVIRVFSGKLGTAVEAARQAVGMLEEKREAA